MFALGSASFSRGFLFRWFGLLHAVEVAFESIDVSGPEAAELGQPHIQLPKWFRFEPVETALGVYRGFDETGVAQHAQVLGHGGLGHAKPAFNLAYGLF
jgi:hypothetical protein